MSNIEGEYHVVCDNANEDGEDDTNDEYGKTASDTPLRQILQKNKQSRYSSDLTTPLLPTDGNILNQRDQWNNKCEFILSMVGYAVGLGNIWRFPYLAYENGGGSFLIPYIIMLLFAGLPMFFLELVIGQYSGQASILVFSKMCPAFKGIGYGMNLVTFIVQTYFNIILAWALYYIGIGFLAPLPWSYCSDDRLTSCQNLTIGADNHEALHSLAEDFFNHVALGLESPNPYKLNWNIVICLAVAWVIVCVCLIRGIQSSGKVVYFTALFPYVVLTVLFIFSLTLDGSLDGIKYYVTPDFEKLKDPTVWLKAAVQIFFSLGVSFGALSTLASYNNFYNNCHSDVLLVSFINCGTSIFSGFAVFAFIGFMAKTSGKEISEVVDS